MTITPIEKLPPKGHREAETQCDQKPTRNYLKEFMKMNVKYARVDLAYGDYLSHDSALQALRSSVKSSALPIHVLERQGELYLARRDLD